MSLQALMELSVKKSQKQGISEERIRAVLPELRQQISFYREYPDLLVDRLAGVGSEKSHFRFFFYQRIFLRIVMRHKYVYATFPRAWSKSFLSMMVLMLRCILYPGSHLFITAGGKEQAASITMAKVEEICRLIPGFYNEINWERGVSKKSKDDVKYVFKNGSILDILPATERSRGQRRTGGLLEECVLIDQTALNEIIIPTTNVDRQLPDGSRDSKEVVNKSQIYITSAGWKNSFAYQRLIELLVQSVIDPDMVMVIGGTWETPVAEGLLDENFVDQLKLQGTYSEDSFEREYCSVWSGDSENAFFSSEKFDKCRQLLQPEHEFSGRTSKNGYYVIGVDVGRFDCTTEALVFKITPQPQGPSIKSLVNIYTYEAEHFEQQAIHLKKLFYKYQARIMAVDANGVGAGLVDFLVIGQHDPETQEYLPPFGVSNDDENKYKKLRTQDTELDALYLIKANAPINTEAYTYAKTQMASGKVKFLVDEQQAKTKLMSTKVGQNMTLDQRNEYLQPFVLTSILKEQMMNLVQENEGVNIILRQASRSIKKDKFSAFVYGLYYVKQVEDNKQKKRIRDMASLLLFS